MLERHTKTALCGSPGQWFDSFCAGSNFMNWRLWPAGSSTAIAAGDSVLLYGQQPPPCWVLQLSSWRLYGYLAFKRTVCYFPGALAPELLYLIFALRFVINSWQRWVSIFASDSSWGSVIRGIKLSTWGIGILGHLEEIACDERWVN